MCVCMPCICLCCAVRVVCQHVFFTYLVRFFSSTRVSAGPPPLMNSKVVTKFYRTSQVLAPLILEYFRKTDHGELTKNLVMSFSICTIENMLRERKIVYFTTLVPAHFSIWFYVHIYHPFHTLPITHCCSISCAQQPCNISYLHLDILH